MTIISLYIKLQELLLLMPEKGTEAEEKAYEIIASAMDDIWMLLDQKDMRQLSGIDEKGQWPDDKV